MLIQALINRGMCNHIQIGAPVFMLTKRDGLSWNDRWKCFAWKEKKKSFYRCSFSPILGRNVKLLKWPLKKKLKPNLSKTLQVLGTAAIVSEMNAIQFKLAVHFIPHVHLLISKYIIHTLSPKRDLWIRPVNAGANCHWVLSQTQKVCYYILFSRVVINTVSDALLFKALPAVSIS